MKSQLFFFDEFIKIMSGQWPDIYNESEEEINNDFTCIGIVPECVREVFIQAHLCAARVKADSERIAGILQHDSHGHLSDGALDIWNARVRSQVCACMIRLARKGCIAYIPACLHHSSEFGVFKHWLVGIPLSRSIAFDRPVLDPTHIAVTCFDKIRDIVSGQSPFNSNIEFEDIKLSDIEVGQVTDERLKQLYCLYIALRDALQAIGLYDSINDELLAFKDASVREYALFKCASRIAKESFELCHSLIEFSLIRFLNKGGADIVTRHSSLSIRNGWTIVVPE